jgi:hypothetical protein
MCVILGWQRRDMADKALLLALYHKTPVAVDVIRKPMQLPLWGSMDRVGLSDTESLDIVNHPHGTPHGQRLR